MARYVERAENVARFIEVTLNLNLDRKLEQQGQWEPLILTTGDKKDFSQRYGAFDQESVVQFLAFDSEYANSILSSLAMARENARTVREVISNDMWTQINDLYHQVKSSRPEPDDLHAFFESVKRGAITFAGLSASTMSRGEGWQWLRLGLLLERADKTSRILDVKYFMLLPGAGEVGSNEDHVQWRALLQSASALQMYRQTNRHMTPASVAEFMLLDQQFPRSMAYCISRADTSLHAITGNPPGRFSNEAEKCLGRARAALCYADIGDVIAGGLHEFIDQQQQVLNRIDDHLYDQYFALPAGV
jgi:uncharacterized alpha-E superfamily protein